MKVKASKVWADEIEQLEYADFDAAGMPIFQMEAGDIGTAQLNSSSVLAKVDAIGGPALRGSYVMPLPFIVQAGFTLRIAMIQVKGLTTGAMLAADSLNLNVLIIPVAVADILHLYAHNGTGANVTILKGTIFNFAFFVP